MDQDEMDAHMLDKIEQIHAHKLGAGVSDGGADCLMDEVTGRWYDGGLEAALFAWEDPLDDISAYDQNTLNNLFAIVWCACIRRGLGGAWIPYRVIVTELLKLMGLGGRVSEKTKRDNEWAWRELGHAHLWAALIDPAARWLRERRTEAATAIQKRWRGRLGRLERVRRKAAIRRIQRGCHAWILKPVTADGKDGINVRILGGMGI